MVLTVALAFVAAASAGCGLELPQPPDVSSLVRKYEQPTGELTAQNADTLMARLAERAGNARAGAPVALLDALLSRIADLAAAPPPPSSGEDGGRGESDGPPATSRTTLLGQGFVVAALARLQRVCPGWGSASSADDGSAGSVDLQLALDRDGLVATAWGGLSHCRFARRGRKIELDGRLRIHFGGEASRVSPADLKHAAYLVAFEGLFQAQADAQQPQRQSLQFDFRASPDGEFELSTDLPDQTNVVAVLTTDLLELGGLGLLNVDLRTRSTRWRCAIDPDTWTGSCTDTLDAHRVVRF